MKAYFETNECVEPFLDLISELTFGCWTWATWVFRGSCPNCTGDVFWNFRIRPPRNRPYYKGDRITDLARQVNLVQFPFCRWNFPLRKLQFKGFSTSSGLDAPLDSMHRHRAITDEVYPPEGCWDPLARHGIPVAVFFWCWNAYFGWLMFFLSQQELYKSTCFLKCHYCVV